MPRPRTHDIDELLDVAEGIVTASGPGSLTLRGLAAASGVSNGSIYHAFSSKEELLARVWLRTAQRFLALQAAEVEQALSVGDSRPVDAVVTAALAPVAFATSHPTSARLFFMQRRDQLFSLDLSPATVEELEVEQRRFTALLVQLAEAMWQRRDSAAVEAIAACVVDVPGGLVRRRLLSEEGLDEQTGARVDAAVRAILDLPAPPRRTRGGPSTPTKE